MIRFLFKGLIRDRQRSLLPALVVAAGVTMTVFLVCYIAGVLGDFANFSAKFSTGHVRIMTNAYSENIDQRPMSKCASANICWSCGVERLYFSAGSTVMPCSAANCES